MSITFSHIIQSTNAELYGQAHIDPSAIIEECYYDTRKIFRPHNALFLCLAPSKQQQLHHIEIAEKKGISLFIIPHSLQPNTSNSLFLKVPDVLQAFQLLAQAQRKTFTSPVIGITGSNGKTIIKEWLASTVQSHFHVLKSPASYNSQLGVPLSVYKLSQAHNLAIFEAGISQPDEMESLEKMIKPTIGILSNIGDAHSEGFTNNTHKLHEKLKLFRHCGLLILEATPLITKKLVESHTKARIISWSSVDKSVDYFVHITKYTNHSKVSWRNDRDRTFTISFTDNASIKNSIHVILCCQELGLKMIDIQAGLNKLEPVSMRLSMIKAKRNSLVINDSYNADMTSLTNALEFATIQQQNRSLQLIMTDFDQLNQDATYAKNLAEILGKFPLNTVHYIGKNKVDVGKSIALHVYDSVDEVSLYFDRNPISNTLLLVKGARRFQLENLVNQFRQNIHRTQLTISLSAIHHNIGLFRKLVGEKTEILAVIKASAYGSDSISLGKEILKNGINQLAVAYYDEAKELREEGISAPIMIMNPDPLFSHYADQYGLDLEIYSVDQLRKIIETGRGPLRLHLKIDSGMNRLGFKAEDVAALVDILSKNRMLEVLSIFSHLAAAEDSLEDAFTEEQHAQFEKIYKTIAHSLDINPKKHICNSNAAIRFPQFHHDMIRVGIGLYGYVANLDTQIAHRLTSYVAQTKEIEVGETVGYNRSFVAKESMTVATISIGFADGLSRKLGNGAFSFIIQNTLVPTVGHISMDTCSIDITGLQVQAGDEVVIFHTFDRFYEMAAVSEQTPYELLSAIGPRVTQEFVKE